MASITIRNLDEALKARLRVRTAHHGHSDLGEHQARDNLAELAESLFGADGWELEPHPPVEVRMPPDLDA